MRLAIQAIAAVVVAAPVLLIALPRAGVGETPAIPDRVPGTAVKPAALRPGDTIALVAPAGRVVEKKVREAVRNIERRGYHVVVMPGVHDGHGYLAGRDEVRVRDLENAFRDPKIKMVLCARGGYGSPRLLDLIDFDVLRRNPKIFVGYSDASALVVGIHQRANMVTFHGPMATTDFSGGYGLAPFSAAHFWRLVEDPATTKDTAGARLENWGGTAPRSLGVLRALAPGVVEGTLTGGNLSTVTALVGTSHEIDTRGKILFLEDVNEEPFRIDRMLCQLHLAGKLRASAGVLLGAFTRCEPRKGSDSFTVNQVLMQYLGGLNIPVLAGFAAGHLPDQATLPLGSRVRLDATAKRLTILELPTVAASAAGEANGGTR